MGQNLNPIEINVLLDTVFHQNQPIIDQLLYCGTYLLVGPPKIGKSFFVLQLGYHIATGTPLWGFTVKRRKVLYISLEDTFGRLQKRYSTMFGVDTELVASNFIFATESKSLSDGLIEELDNFIQNTPNIGLIIIDTLQKVRSVCDNVAGYSADYAALGNFKKLSDKYNLAIIVVHHTRKMEATDAFETISGTNGLLGAADGALVIQKAKRTENYATINIVGRDQTDLQLSVEFDRQKLQWLIVDSNPVTSIVKPNPILEAIDNFLTDTWSGTPTELLKELALEDIAANSFTRKLNVLSSILLDTYNILYINKHKHERIITLKRKSCDDSDDISLPSSTIKTSSLSSP